jgi:hypothetical protein
MRGTIMIFGGTREDRLRKVGGLVDFREKGPDVLVLELEGKKKSIGIEKARELKKFFEQKPYGSDTKSAVVKDAQALTVQAQNALLKILEEPPSYANIILEVPYKNSLIETVRSRCQMVQVGRGEVGGWGKAVGEVGKSGGGTAEGIAGGGSEKTAKESAEEREKQAGSRKAWEKIKKLSVRQKLDLAEKYARKDRGTVIKVVGCWIEEERKGLREGGEGAEVCGENLKILSKIHRDLRDTNVHLGLSLDLLLLSVR